MSIKASLKVILMANDVVVAESEDPTIWQSVFTSITQGGVIQSPSTQVQNEAQSTFSNTVAAPQENAPQSAVSSDNSSGSPLNNLANELGISEDLIQAALSPEVEAPYFHLDHHCWEAYMKSNPSRGNKAIPPVALIATLLAGWFKHIKKEGLTTKECHNVLKQVHFTANNVNRSLRNSKWLQLKNNNIVINPVETSKALDVFRAFCQKNLPL
jgi:hypothetical protein